MKVDQAINQLNEIIRQLQNEYKVTGKKFTLDGRLVGDIGEILAAEKYGIKLFRNIVDRYDGITDQGQPVQIKATFKNTLGFPTVYDDIPEIYLGIKILDNAEIVEIYNGPGKYIWNAIKDFKRPKNGLHSISITKLCEINKQIDDKERIKTTGKKILTTTDDIKVKISSKDINDLRKIEDSDLAFFENKKITRKMKIMGLEYKKLKEMYYDKLGYIYEYSNNSLYLFLLQIKEFRE